MISAKSAEKFGRWRKNSAAHIIFSLQKIRRLFLPAAEIFMRPFFVFCGQNFGQLATLSAAQLAINIVLYR
jgi:hypothetical protein